MASTSVTRVVRSDRCSRRRFDGLSECSFAQTDETLVESALPGSVLRDEVPGDVVVGGVGSDAVVPLTFEG